jgi:hypothetical protein
MSLSGESASFASCFSYENIEKLAEACVDFYRKSLGKNGLDAAYERRVQLAKHARKFHWDCGTLSPGVEEAIKNLESGSCLLLMTAHQPNLFAYSGVLRKAVLNRVLAQRLSDYLKVPVVCFFGVADQDFTDDRWVRSALLPDVERRNGVLDMRLDMPEKLMLNRVAKPSVKVLDGWRSEIKNWVDRKLRSVASECRSFGLPLVDQSVDLTGNFEGFWKLVEDAYGRAERYADFNAFVMSLIVNRVWGYDTVFSRFSECQQIFEDEFSFLLSRFGEYSRFVKEAMAQAGSLGEGVYEREFETVPFWYNCGCGGKARLRAEQKGEHLVGEGCCVRCGREYEFDFGLKVEPQLSEIMRSVSARGIAMPLVFFEGLKVGCYVGGVGGAEYLRQARYVAERLGTSFAPVVVWRPKDVYFGVGQLDALMVFRRLSGSFDLSQYARVEADLRRKVVEVQGKLDALEAEKRVLCGSGGLKEAQIEKLKVLSARQVEVRRETGFSVLVRNLGLLENVGAVLGLYPCIVDYAVNVGLRETGEQWVAFLQGNGGLSSDVRLRTGFDDVAACVRSGFGG